MRLACLRLSCFTLRVSLLLAMTSAGGSLAAQTPVRLTLQKISGDDQVIPFGHWQNFAARVTDSQGRPVAGAKIAWQMPDIGTYTYVGATDSNGISTATNMYTFSTPVTYTQIAIIVDRDTPIGFTDISKIRPISGPVKFTFHQGDSNSSPAQVPAERGQNLRHFRWTYSYAPPGQQQRDWVQKSPTRWVEIYPNGNESSFTLQQSSAVLDGVQGIILSKDGASMLVFVPDVDIRQVNNKYGDWLRFQSAGDPTHKWNFLGQFTEVPATQSSANSSKVPGLVSPQAQISSSSPAVSAAAAISKPQQRQAAQQQAAQRQAAATAPARQQASSSSGFASPPPTSPWVDKLLGRAGSGSCPSSVSSQDGIPPEVKANECMRDRYVKAAVLHAWAAKCYMGAERDNTARKEIKAMFENLQAAQDMCSTHPMVFFGPVTPCDTERIYRCGELGGDAASYAQQMNSVPAQNNSGGNSTDNPAQQNSDPCRDKPKPCAAAAK